MPEPVPISIFHRSEFYTCRFVIMSAENVQLAIGRNIELAFVKKAKIEFKGDRAEARILVSTYVVFKIFDLRVCSERNRSTGSLNYTCM